MEELVAAQGGDGGAFDRLIGPFGPSLRAHCYRMLGSIHDADDAVQDAMVRAWRGLAGFRGDAGGLRSWLYTVATRACLDAIRGRSRRALPYDLGPASDHVQLESAARTEVAWLGPYPGGEDHTAPETSYERREALELAFVAACQRLPGNQRAALLLIDVLGFPVTEVATIMDTSPTAINSALARARRMITAELPEQSQLETARRLGDGRLRELVGGFAAAMERADLDGLVALLTEDVSWSMPPLPAWYQGIERVAEFTATVPLACGTWRCVIMESNGQPAVACYLRGPEETEHRAWSISVLTLRADKIAAVTSFLGDDHFTAFGLPLTVPSAV